MYTRHRLYPLNIVFWGGGGGVCGGGGVYYYYFIEILFGQVKIDLGKLSADSGLYM